MPQTILNIGWNPATWIAVVMVLIVLFFLYRAGRALWVVYKTHNVDYDYDVQGDRVLATALEKKKAIRNAVIAIILLALVIVFFYFSFGPGQRAGRITPAGKEGMMEMVEEMPSEKSLETIKEEAYRKKPEELRRIDEGFQKDAEEADAYLKKALEKANYDN